MNKNFYIFIIFLCFLNILYAKEKDFFIQNVIFTYENDSIYGKDRYYTNGLQMFFLTKNFNKNKENKVFSKIFNIKKNSFYNYSFGIGQKIYTPNDIKVEELITNDRPYAGYLYLFLNKNIYHDNKIDTIGFSIGTTGPNSYGKIVQTKIHNLIGSPEPMGWDYQLSNELLIMTSWLRTIDIHKTKDYTNDWKIIPKFSINLGTPFTKSDILLEFRYGWNLDNDFTENKITVLPLGITKNEKKLHFNDLSYYLFTQINGSIVLYNTFLDGNINGYRPNIKKNLLTYEINCGLSIRWKQIYLKYSNIYTSKEFKEQQGNQIIFLLTVGYLF